LPRILLLCCAAVTAFAHPCLAGQASTTSETLIRLNVRPAPAPKPALRYRLLPELKEMNPGNPIQSYINCMMAQKKFFLDDGNYQNRQKLLTMPLNELPAQKLPDEDRYALSEADWAARLDNPNWQILLKLKADGIELLLPEVQQLRSLARGLQVRFRAEIAQCRFDDAIRTAKTMFAMSRHLGEHPSLIGNLVGIAIASITISNLDEMLMQPGCPNLYWALTVLPSPLISLDKGMDGERVMLGWVFRDLSESTPMNKDQLKKFVAEADKLLDAVDEKGGKGRLRPWLEGRIKDTAVVTAARQHLVEYGIPEKRVTAFSAEQVILLDDKRELESRVDDDHKTINLPLWQAEMLAAQIKSKSPPALFADLLVPVTLAARRAQARVVQRISLLRHIEALRLHAAEHDGALPAQLTDVAVPLPVDPITGKSFRYEVTGNTAHVRGSPPSGQEKIPAFNIHYELTLQK
jgi:hypothetical protein